MARHSLFVLKMLNPTNQPTFSCRRGRWLLPGTGSPWCWQRWRYWQPSDV